MSLRSFFFVFVFVVIRMRPIYISAAVWKMVVVMIH